MCKKIIDWLLWKRRWVLTSLLQKPEYASIYERIKNDTTLNPSDLFNVYSCTEATQKIDGDIAEVGVYKGGSAKVISMVKGYKTLHLFDTFNGLPEPTKFDLKQLGGIFKEGDFNCSLESVKDYLYGLPNIEFYKGNFPDTTKPIENKRFSFVHLDVDIYQSTKDCLEFLYPRLNSGGIILSHDYPNSLGVKKAFDEFFKDKPEVLIRLLDQQVMIIRK